MEEDIQEKKRRIDDAPNALTKKSVKEWFISNGAKGVVKKTVIANILGINPRTVKNAEKNKKLKAIVPGIYTLEDIVDWAIENPKLLAQDVGYWEITEELLEHVKATLLSKHPTFIKVWNNDVEDLASEVCLRISKRKKLNYVDETYIINSAIIGLWRFVKSRGIDKTVSLETLKKESHIK